MKIGHGYDVHKLVEDRDLFIGGVKLDYHLGLLGHSDADVLSHAICDALIGAAGKGDIGKHFPPTDMIWKDVSGLELLQRVAKILADENYIIGNIDATVIAQMPKLSPYIPLMLDNISTALGCERKKINIKATTEEGLGFTGSGEGIAAHCVCIIRKDC